MRSCDSRFQVNEVEPLASFRSFCSLCSLSFNDWTNDHWDWDRGQLFRSTTAWMQYECVWQIHPHSNLYYKQPWWRWRWWWRWWWCHHSPKCTLYRSSQITANFHYFVILLITQQVFESGYQVIHSNIHFWNALLSVHSAQCRHRSPEWMILSHVDCFVQGEIHWFKVLPGSLHPRSMGASRWSPPVLQGGSC